MADLKISELDLITSFDLDFAIEVFRPNEAAAEDRNVQMELVTLFGALTTSAATSLQLSAAPHIYLFNGSSDAAWVLPQGTANLVGVPIKIGNIGSAFLDVSGGGSPPDTVDEGNSDPYNIPPGDRKIYIFTWTGSTWLIT